jgi:hypothetical protein
MHGEYVIVGAGFVNKAFVFRTVPVAPFAPTALTSPSQTRSSIAVTWTAPTDDGSATITDYSIQYSTSASMSSPTTKIVGSASTSCTLTGLTAGTTYYANVADVNSIGTGTYSTTSNIK